MDSEKKYDELYEVLVDCFVLDRDSSYKDVVDFFEKCSSYEDDLESVITEKVINNIVTMYTKAITLTNSSSQRDVNAGIDLLSRLDELNKYFDVDFNKEPRVADRIEELASKGKDISMTGYKLKKLTR